jgi:hypothetical protein
MGTHDEDQPRGHRPNPERRPVSPPDHAPPEGDDHVPASNAEQVLRPAEGDADPDAARRQAERAEADEGGGARTGQA